MRRSGYAMHLADRLSGMPRLNQRVDACHGSNQESIRTAASLRLVQISAQYQGSIYVTSKRSAGLSLLHLNLSETILALLELSGCLGGDFKPSFRVSLLLKVYGVVFKFASLGVSHNAEAKF